MTVDEARKLKKGDRVNFRGEVYKVLHTKECRGARSGDIYITVKCHRGNEKAWFMNEFISFVEE